MSSPLQSSTAIRRLGASMERGRVVIGGDELMELYPYQKQVVDWFLAKGSGLNGCEVGLGKTLMTISIIKETKPDSVLILCPAILKWQWKDELARFLPDVSVAVIDGSAEERAALWQNSATIKIANYELLLRDLAVMPKAWDMMVCDEATRIANCWTKTYKTLYQIKARRRIALTGTPISNSPNELWGILNWCYPGRLGKYREFIDRYCVRNIWGGIFGFQNLKELAGRVEPMMIRKQREEVLPELPEKIVSEIPFTLSDEEKELYEKLQKELLFEINAMDIAKLENPTTIQNSLVKMLRLRQVTNSLELVGEKKKSSKLEGLKELLPTVLENDRKGIIFTFFSSMADILERELAEYRPLKITGDVDGREDIVKRFNEAPDNRLLIMTSAGQYGLNIQAASVIVHYDQTWSLAQMEQREGRAYRIGQQRNVLVYHLLGKGTIDMYVRRVLRGKQKVADIILGDDVKQMLQYAD